MVSLEREHITPMDIDDASTNPSRSTPIKTASNVLSKLADSDSESETSNAPLPRKTGRGLLSRLQPQSEDSSDSDDQDANEAAFQRTMKRFTTSKVADILSSDDDDDGSGEDAYARMKKQLAAGPSEKSTPEPEKTVPARLVPAAISSDEEDDVPVRASTTRRARPRKERTASPSATPSPSVQSRRSSPGLFCTPNATPVKRRTSTAHVDEHDSDQSTKPTHTADFNERVKRIRAERLAQKEQEKEQAKQARKEKAKTARREADAEPGSDSDGESGRRLTQQAKPTRKAGKKAMEAMVRDQQRIVRSMQLTHQSKTKKRYGTKDLFAKMGYTAGLADSGLPTPDPSSQPASPDVEMDQNDNTLQNPSHEDTTMNDIVDAAMDNLSEPAPANEIASSPPRLNKGKGRAPEFQHLPPNAAMEQLKPLTVQNAQISTKKPTNALMVELSDSEDDLEIVKPKSRFPVFDRLPEKQAQENPSLLHLRHLAQLTLSNDHGPRGKKSMNNTELQISLHRKAREQAQKAREEKLAELRAKGWHIPTEEEREKQQAEVEDMVAQLEKAREHDAKLAKRERAQAKEDGETGDGLLSSDEDEDYVASGEEDAAEDGDLIGGEEEAELEFSGSEDEEAEDQLDDEEENADKPEGLIDEMADEDDEEEAEAEAVSNEPQLDDGDVEDDEPAAPVRNRAVKRGRNLVIDDEDEDDVVGMNGSPTQEATQDDGMAAFGFGNAAPALGLTQAFAGTMASLGSGSQTELPEPEQDSLDFLRSLPDTQPDVNFSSQADFLIPDSQTLESQDGPISNKIDLGISQFFQVPPEFTATQLSEVPEPTQDAGFLLSRSPAGFATMPSTIDTVMMPIAESPIQARKGKLHQRRRETPVELSDVDDMTTSASEAEDEPAFTTKGKDVFSIMKKAAKKQKKVEDFNKQTSWAKDIVEEQAHESEDEYAGLGGASDDESGNEMDEELAKMIDTNDVKVNESELAAYFNEQETKTDAARAAKLHQDIISGALRKRTGRGNAFDMSDSEDEGEMRRRRAQRERQRMSKAILQDERIGKLAQNSKQAAFINTMIDTYDDSEYGFLNEPEQPAQESQSQSQDVEPREGEGAEGDLTIPDSQISGSPNSLKRKSDFQEKENRVPANQRRPAAPAFTNPHKKARTLPEIQHQLSELLEDPGVIIPDSQYISDDSDGGGEDFTPPALTTSKSIVVDRLTLSRQSSSMTDANATIGRNMAFGTSAQIGGFRVPSLVRRATSNFSTVSERSASASVPSESVVRRGGTGKSNIHAQAREAERRVVLEKAERKRKESLKKKVGRARGTRSVLGALDGGFE